MFGVELSRWATRIARQKFNLNIFEGSLEQAGFSDESFDAVVMLDSIEHLTHPRETLEQIRKILKPDGILCISTPDIESWMSKILRAKWWGIKFSHLFYFSKKTLSQMLHAVGLEVVEYSSYARIFSFGYWNKKLAGYQKRLQIIFKMIAKIFFLDKKLIKIDFKDQIMVFAKKYPVEK